MDQIILHEFIPSECQEVNISLITFAVNIIWMPDSTNLKMKFK